LRHGKRSSIPYDLSVRPMGEQRNLDSPARDRRIPGPQVRGTWGTRPAYPPGV
jgi:hypothetical protein